MNEEPTPEIEEFDVDSIPTTDKLLSVHQEGNYLVGLTEFGVRFRQRIPQGKMLNKKDGRYVLENVTV